MKARLVALGCFVLTGKSSFVVDLVYFLSPSIKVFVFVNTTRTELDLPQKRKCFFSFRSLPLRGKSTEERSS